MDKMCRICWNTNGWKSPSGSAKEQGKSFVRKNGYGFEEWLFRFDWMLQGYNGNRALYHYGNLQAIGKYVDKYVGTTRDILLYTVPTPGQAFYVGVVRNVYVPDKEEASWAFKKFIKYGWYETMQKEVGLLGRKEWWFPKSGDNPHWITNVRFKPSDVEFAVPHRLIPDTSKVYKINRYHPLNWDDMGDRIIPTSPGVQSEGNDEIDDLKKYSELLRIRAAIEGIEYSPKQAPIQNQLIKFLKQYLERRNGTVGGEIDRVDVKVLTGSGQTVLFEIKPALSAKLAIRNALGQLLEYSCYPRDKGVRMLVVVNDYPLMPTDTQYIQSLQEKFGLNLYYLYWTGADPTNNPEFCSLLE